MNGKPACSILQGFPWENLQFLPMNYGKPFGHGVYRTIDMVVALCRRRRLVRATLAFEVVKKGVKGCRDSVRSYAVEGEIRWELLRPPTGVYSPTA